ncbi:MAG: hypothetical protein U5K69_21845 [Balneolaceae bacterium]|nr:hypothetical protein [Balneolaceae bacterium]
MIQNKKPENSSPRLVTKILALQDFMDEFGEKFKELDESEAEIIEKLANGIQEHQIAEEIGVDVEQLHAQLTSTQKKLSILDETSYIKYGLALGLIRILVRLPETCKRKRGVRNRLYYRCRRLIITAFQIRACTIPDNRIEG